VPANGTGVTGGVPEALEVEDQCPQEDLEAIGKPVAKSLSQRRNASKALKRNGVTEESSASRPAEAIGSLVAHDAPGRSYDRRKSAREAAVARLVVNQPAFRISLQLRWPSLNIYFHPSEGGGHPRHIPPGGLIASGGFCSARICSKCQDGGPPSCDSSSLRSKFE
jgi:hypothetical protein